MTGYVDPCLTPPENVPPIQVFDTDEAFLAAMAVGMELCTSDFTGWADIVGFDADSEGGPTVLAAKMTDGTAVRVPVRDLIDIREGHCVRVDRVRATVDAQGWEEPA